jgi:hypothetical protein
VLAALAFLRAARTYEADKAHAGDAPVAAVDRPSDSRDAFPIHKPGTQS